MTGFSSTFGTAASIKFVVGTTGVSIYNIHLSGGVAYVSIAVSEVPPYVEVVSPNGGEYFESGEQDTIRWIAFDDLVVDSIGIYLSTDGGMTFPYVIATGEPNDSSYIWTVGSYNSTTCRIKVVAYDDSGNVSEDISDDDFTISDISGVGEIASVRLDGIKVLPNPSGGDVKIVFSAPSARCRVRIYDVMGKLVAELYPKSTADHSFEALWDGRNKHGASVPGGIYFARISSGAASKTVRLTLIK